MKGSQKATSHPALGQEYQLRRHTLRSMKQCPKELIKPFHGVSGGYASPACLRKLQLYSTSMRSRGMWTLLIID